MQNMRTDVFPVPKSPTSKTTHRNLSKYFSKSSPDEKKPPKKKKEEIIEICSGAVAASLDFFL